VQEIVLSGDGSIATSAIASGSAEPRHAPRAVPTGWSAEVPVDDGTQMVSLTWAGSSDAAVRVRAPKPGGGWGPWLDLHSDPDEGPDQGGNGRNGVGPVFLGHDGSDTVQIEVESGSLTDLRMDAMAWVPPTAGNGAGAEPAGPRIHSRSEWAPGGWRPDNPGCTAAPKVMERLRFAVVHHTVESNSYRASDVPGMLAATYRYHTQSRGWCDIAYNFLIDRFGQVWQGRSGSIDLPIQGGHAKGFNTDSVGIALIGQHQPGASPGAVSPSSAELTALRHLIAWKFAIHGLDPLAKISITSLGSTKYAEGKKVTLPRIQGHRDSSLTSCPGELTYTRLASLRSAVATEMKDQARPSTWTPFTTGQAFFTQLVKDANNKLPTNTESAQRTSQVVRSGRSRATVADPVVVSKTTDDRIGSVWRLYVAAMGRRPDRATFDTLVRRHDRQVTLETMGAEFARTPEFIDRYGAMDNPTFVAAVFQNLLGRAPTSTEQSSWVSKLGTSTTRASFVVQMSRTASYKAKMLHESRVVDIWFVLLRRAPDSGAFNTWLPKFGSGTSTATAVSSVLSSSEYRRRFP